VSERFSTWKEAHTAAVKLARFLNHDVGIWRAVEFGRDGFNIRSLPRPKNRYGHELRCEVVSPSDPRGNIDAIRPAMRNLFEYEATK
jgi:hypothetical protein